MKVIYVDTKNNEDYYINGVETMKARIVFTDDNDLFVYYTEDTENMAYINKVINKALKPNIFNLYNFVAIEDQKQYDRYDNFIQDLYNFQATQIDERVDGSDEYYAEDDNIKFYINDNKLIL